MHVLTRRRAAAGVVAGANAGGGGFVDVWARRRPRAAVGCERAAVHVHLGVRYRSRYRLNGPRPLRRRRPEGRTYADTVHQGRTMLVLVRA